MYLYKNLEPGGVKRDYNFHKCNRRDRCPSECLSIRKYLFKIKSRQNNELNKLLFRMYRHARKKMKGGWNHAQCINVKY